MPSLGKAWKYSHGVGLGGSAALRGLGKQCLSLLQLQEFTHIP